MKEWVPNVTGAEKPLYQAIVQALESDIRAGVVAHGTRLAPQRDLADQLKISVGTVSRAYAEAERLGLVTAGVGRGTFVNSRARATPALPSAPWNFALNAPPRTGEGALIAKHLGDIASEAALDTLMGYLPHAGHPEHCAILASAISNVGMDVDERSIILTPGAQHALDIALRLTARANDPVVTEAYTFSGLTALAGLSDYALVGANLDEDGLVPEALDDALERSGAQVVYATPTLQTPTGTVMSRARREKIAEVLERRNVWFVEDDAYAFLPERPVIPISALIPDRSFYVTSFAKSLAPGLRLGALVPPRKFRERAAMAMRATGWMAAPVMAEVVSRMVSSGDFDRQVRLKRKVAAERTQLARDVLGDLIVYAPDVSGYHVWVRPPDGSDVLSVLNRASAAGIVMAAPLLAKMSEPVEPGLRLCLGGFASDAELANALEAVERLLRSASDMSYV